jgi:hypothetical protein
MTKGNQTGRRGAGNPEGIASDLRRMIFEALAEAGGAEYLERQADKTPGAFLALVGKLISAQSRSKDAGPVETPQMSDLEVARRLAFLLARGAEALHSENSTGQDVPGLPVRLKR